MEEIEFYTVEEIQEILHIGRSKAYDLLRVPGFPIIRIGNRTLIFKKDFYEWLEENKGNYIKVY